ncbi:MAG: IS91 family transposase [Hyphomonadaceae bacterium]
MRPSLEVADIFARFGDAYRQAHKGHLNLSQLKVMSAIVSCRTAVLGGHVEGCTKCDHTKIAYNSCRNRHCPKCQGAAARDWLAKRQEDLLPLGYFHVVFTLPHEIGDIAWYNKTVIYDLLFKAASQTLMTIAADRRHLGARIGITAVLHTWGSALTHHPHIHMIVPGGGLSKDGKHWIRSRAKFLLPVRVLSKLFRRLFLDKLMALHRDGQLRFFGDQAPLADPKRFASFMASMRAKKWVVYLSGPDAVLAYLARYTHRVAISNKRLIAIKDTGITFAYKDYRRPSGNQQQTMTLTPEAFITRFLLHVLPKGFHRIRHYGFLSSGVRVKEIMAIRHLLGVPERPPKEADNATPPDAPPTKPGLLCPCCGGDMVIIDIFECKAQPRAPPHAQPNHGRPP